MEYRVFNYKKQNKDKRDYKLYFTAISKPNIIDLRTKCPPIIDQGNLGSCTACAVSACHQYQDLSFFPSILFIYYNSRAIQGTISYDSGSSLRNAIKVDVKYGVCNTISWPYNINQYQTCPSKSCYDEALEHQISKYASINNTAVAIEATLANGYPIVFGFLVYSSFLKSKNGYVPFPNTMKEQFLGGHAMTIVGYNRTKQIFICQNSWGTEWGDKGFCYMPYKYILNNKLAFDFWVIYNVEKLPNTAKIVMPIA